MKEENIENEEMIWAKRMDKRRRSKGGRNGERKENEK
jgi:hypothetical protein